MIRGYNLKDRENIFEIGIKGDILRIDFTTVSKVDERKSDINMRHINLDLSINSKKIIRNLSAVLEINSILLDEKIKVEQNTLFEIEIKENLENWLDDNYIYMEIEYK